MTHSNGLSMLDAATKSRLAYASYYLKQTRLIYVETPKAACTGMKNTLAVLAGCDIVKTRKSDMALKTDMMTIHDRKLVDIPSLCDLSDDEFNQVMNCSQHVRFCIIRNPYTRIASAWNDRLLCQTLSPKAPILEHIGYPDYRADWEYLRSRFAEFVNHIYHHEAPEFSNHHWQSMGQLLLPDVVNYSHILRLEQLDKEIKPIVDHVESSGACWPGIPIVNKTPVPAAIQLYNAQTAARVRDIYARDFSQFGYSTKIEVSTSSSLTALPDEAWMRALQQRNRRISALSLMRREQI